MAERTEAECIVKLQAYEDRYEAIMLTSATRRAPGTYKYKIKDKTVDVGEYLKYLMEGIKYWKKRVENARLRGGNEIWQQADFEVDQFGEDLSEYIGDTDTDWYPRD